MSLINEVIFSREIPPKRIGFSSKTIETDTWQRCFFQPTKCQFRVGPFVREKEMIFRDRWSSLINEISNSKTKV